MGSDHYDLIVIGSGPGGASLAHRLAPSGKRILILERGDYLPRSEKNWNSQTVFVDGAYQADETWTNSAGDLFHPALHYYVGGNSKVYGAALFRLRERDFGEVVHAGGVSPAWPLGYDAFEPYYTEAERLFHVHGQRGEDPLEPWASAPYSYPPVTHEPKIAQLADNLRGIGLHPFHLPLGILLDEKDGRPTPTSICMRCSFFDGFPCLLNGKADAQVVCIDPMLARYPNITLLTGAYVSKLGTDRSGRTVNAVHVTRKGQEELYSADLVVVACGALSSALLLLRSANDAHPDGLANGSGQVGRNYMRHNMSVLMAVMPEVNETVFQKTLAFSDFYFGADDWSYPLGLVQMCATSHSDQIRGEALPEWLEWLPEMPFETMARHSMDFWLQAEDLPHPDNRVYYRDRKVHLDLVETNPDALAHLKRKLKEVLNRAGHTAILLERSLYLGKDIPLGGTAHQAGTARFGTDPRSSVLDLDCKAHELDILYRFDQAARVMAIETAGRLFKDPHARLSINFMPNAVYEPRACIQQSLAAAKRANFPAKNLMFEFTENERVIDPAHVERIVQAYKELGFLTALDDFGAGYAGLSLLARLRTDIIKIDMELLRDIHLLPAKQIIVGGLVEMARQLNVHVLAEGVECEAELLVLRAAGIRLFQGYFFAKPALMSLPKVPFLETTVGTPGRSVS